METTHYAHNTSITVMRPWSTYIRARALCPDGKVRSIKLAITADTFFSVPARLSYRGTTVSGFMSMGQTPYKDCFSSGSFKEQTWVEFTPTGSNAHLLRIPDPKLP